MGSLSHGDYEVTAPKKVKEDYHNEEGYQLACKRFYPAIDEADLVIVYGIIGEHTRRDIEYATSGEKRIIYINEGTKCEYCGSYDGHWTDIYSWHCAKYGKVTTD